MKVVFFKKQFCLAKTVIIHYLSKEVQKKLAGDKNVDIVREISTSYSTDGGVQLNKNSKYCHFHFWSLK